MQLPTDTSSAMYQVRRQVASQRPEDRGELVQEFNSFAAAFAFIATRADRAELFVAAPNKD